MKHGLALLMFAAVQLGAQQPPRPAHEQPMCQMMQSDDLMTPMMDVGKFSPEQLLAGKDSLHLTMQQVSSLTALRNGAKEAHDAAMTQARSHMNAMASGADTAGVRQHFDAAHRAMADAHWAMLTAARQARALLSENQRSSVDRWSKHKGQQHEHD